MKYRNGFVSNSSSSSFCIFGWEVKDINEAGLDDIYDFMKTVRKQCDIYLIKYYGPYGEVVGLGNTAEEFDHYMEDWEDYECDPPTKEEQQKIEELSKRFKLPPPQTYSATWFNG